MAAEDVERGSRTLIAWVLRAGLGAATALMVAGVATKLLTGDTGSPRLTAAELWSSPSTGDLLLGAGVLVLAATPFVRVLALAAIWARMRDWRFVTVAAVVLALLALAATLGGR